MVIADINVLCVQQKKKSKCTISNAQIDCYSLKKPMQEFVYYDRYLMLQEIDGIWYQIFPYVRNEGNYRQEFMDLCIADDEYKVLFLEENFKRQLIKFLTELYFESPLRNLYFCVDLQGYKEKYIEIKWKMFLEMIQKEDINFNTIYHILE